MKKIPWIVSMPALLLFLLTAAFGQVPRTSPIASPKAPSSIPKKTPDLLAQGKKIYGQICLPCHGTQGDGKGPAGVLLKPPPKDFTQPLKQWPVTKGDPQKIFEAITKGIPNTAMVAWPQFSEQERWGLVYYVMEFATTPKAAPAKKK